MLERIVDFWERERVNGVYIKFGFWVIELVCII